MTNVNNLIEPSTISADKVKPIDLPKGSVLPTGFRFIDLVIRSDVFSLFACPNCSATNALNVHDIEDEKKGFERFMQIKCRGCEFKHYFYTSPQSGSSKDNRSRGMKTMEIKVRAVYSFQLKV